MRALIDCLEREHTLTEDEFTRLIENRTPELDEYLFSRAGAVRKSVYGDEVYIRGLIEFTNYCRNDCLYCGIRRSNGNAERYRLTREEILACCEQGYALGFRTFVLQGGEDAGFSDGEVARVVNDIKTRYPDCAVTLSIGERPEAVYRMWFGAGADRYLLRHETADCAHYARLHPPELSASSRQRCLYSLREVGYQVGTGFMVGSPYQTAQNLAQDMCFIHKLQPHMVGIGPFVPHHDTPFASCPAGTADLTLFMLGLLRLMLPGALLPATTALGTIETDGRERGMRAGANVVMPNLSPLAVRKKYMLYDNKISTGDEAAESVRHLTQSMARAGFRVVVSRGDSRIGCMRA